MIRLKYITLFLLISVVSTAQEKRKKFDFSVGTEYRINPIVKSNFSVGRPLVPISAERDRNLSGFGIHYTLGWQFVRNLSLNFSHTFRYNYVYDQRTPIVGEFVNFNDTPVYRLLMDYHFYLEKHFSISSTRTIYARLGVSIANTGARYATREVVEIGEGNLFAVSRDGSLGWRPTNIALGYQTDKFKISLGAYISKNHEFGTVEEPNARIILPYINLSYRLKQF